MTEYCAKLKQNTHRKAEYASLHNHTVESTPNFVRERGRVPSPHAFCVIQRTPVRSQTSSIRTKALFSDASLACNNLHLFSQYFLAVACTLCLFTSNHSCEAAGSSPLHSIKADVQFSAVKCRYFHRCNVALWKRNQQVNLQEGTASLHIFSKKKRKNKPFPNYNKIVCHFTLNFWGCCVCLWGEGDGSQLLKPLWSKESKLEVGWKIKSTCLTCSGSGGCKEGSKEPSSAFWGRIAAAHAPWISRLSRRVLLDKAVGAFPVCNFKQLRLWELDLFSLLWSCLCISWRTLACISRSVCQLPRLFFLLLGPPLGSQFWSDPCFDLWGCLLGASRWHLLLQHPSD